MAKRKSKFMCQDCGYESPKWMGKCPGCGAWNKMVEEVEKAPTRKGAFAHSEGNCCGSETNCVLRMLRLPMRQEFIQIQES